MKKTYVNKKAFTMIEVILALVMISLIVTYIIKQVLHTQYLTAVTSYQNELTEIITEGVIGKLASDGKVLIKAYANGDGDSNCSQNANYDNLTTRRLIDCKNWGTRFDVTAVTATNTWGILSSTSDELMQHYGGCTVEIKEDTSVSSNDVFEVFVDCSEVDWNERSPILLEDATKFVFEVTLKDILDSIEENSESMNDVVNSGDDEDGLIRGKFKL
jgi:prepilin-type N-terminal cleavage/methylation domain-containing protein